MIEVGKSFDNDGQDKKYVQMSLNIDTPILAELHDEDSEDVAEQAIWATLKRALQQQGADDAVMYLQHFISCDLISEATDKNHTRRKYKLYQNISSYDARYNVHTEERMGYMFSALMEDSQKLLSQEECLNIATQEAQIPDGAQQVIAEFQTIGDDEIFLARWHHYHKDLWIEADYIQVMVNAKTGKPFGYQKHWHDVDSELKER